MHLPRDEGAPAHRLVRDLPELLEPGTLLVFNQSRVRKARLYAEGKEYLLLGPTTSPHRWSAMTRKAARLKPGQAIEFPGNLQAAVVSVEDGRVVLDFGREIPEAYFDQWGHVPLPPYIDRADEPEDEERYQTVYARDPGSVAAPTAGLHFTEELLAELQNAGIELGWVTLHVGIGTFLPVRVDNPDDHIMHEESCEISQETAAQVNDALRENRKVIAVGTTSVRTLEAAADGHGVSAFRGETSIFIRPGFTFRVISGLFTNFHTPESTLVMLVSALAGRERILAAYSEAVRERYRFFSYGDAMLIL